MAGFPRASLGVAPLKTMIEHAGDVPVTPYDHRGGYADARRTMSLTYPGVHRS